MTLVQIVGDNGTRQVAVPSRDRRELCVLRGAESVRDLALEAGRVARRCRRCERVLSVARGPMKDVCRNLHR